MNIVFLIIASQNEEHLRDELSQRETWAKNQKSKAIWLRGGKTTRFNLKTKTLYVPIEEKYENILEKTLLGMRWSLENLKFDFLIRANVSTYFNDEKVIDTLKTKPREGLFLGGYLDFKKMPTSNPELFINGGAIFLNRQSVLELQNLKLDQWRHLPDDFAISRYLIKKGCEPAYLPRGNISNTGVIRNHMYYRLKSSENAEMASMRMNKLHEILECKTFIIKIRYYFEFYIQELRNFHRNFKNPVRYCLSVYSIYSSFYRARINRQ